MPYQFDLGAPQPVFYGSENEYIVDFVLGVDTDTAEQILMSVALIEDPNKQENGSPIFDLVFGIRTVAIKGAEPSAPAFDHDTCKKYVLKGQREVVLRQMLQSVKSLVEEVAPSVVTMSTYEASLPVEAMAKYTRISNQMGLCGYEQTEYVRDGTDLKDRWLFRK